jgi:hypothetical protein
VRADGLDLSGYGPNNGGYMAAPAIKSTYTLDVAATAEETPADKLALLEAFRELQRSLQGRCVSESVQWHGLSFCAVLSISANAV